MPVTPNTTKGQQRRQRRIARRKHGDTAFSEEAFTYALERLSADGWALLDDFSDRADSSTYLISVFNNLLVDFWRKRYGRHDRPPKWLKELGVNAIRIYRHLCIERLEPETVVDWLCARGQLRTD